MKILFINPATKKDSDPASGFPGVSRHPPGLYSMSTVLAANGFEVGVLDFEIEEIGLEAAIGREKPDIVGISSSTCSRFEAFRVAKKIREISRDAVVVVGGPHFTFTAEDTLKNIPEIDYVVRGEGEYTMLELVKALQSGSAPEDVEGISFVSEGRVVHNRDRPFIGDLDELPSPDWDSVPLEKYNFKLLGEPCVSISTSRGCPFNCSFCSATRMWGGRPRRRSAKNVVDEIEYLLARLDLNYVYFDDTTFTHSREHVRGICEEIESRGLEFSWSCDIRVDTVDRELLEIMRGAGCRTVGFGVETASPKILDAIEKGITREQVLQTVKDCKELGMYCWAYFMFSLPGETDEDRRMTFEFIEQLIGAGVDDFSVQPTVIFPGTGIERVARERGLLPADFSWSKPFYEPENEAISAPLAHTPLFTENLSLSDIRRIYERQVTRRKAALATHSYRTGKRGPFIIFKRMLEYLWGFTRVRSLEDMRKRLLFGREAMSVLTRKIAK